MEPVPTLRFTPYAWAKLLALRDYGPTEIAGFGVATSDDPLCIEDVLTVRQRCTSVTVAMDDQAVADFFDEQVDRGLKPEQFARLWLHTHPGASAQPSGTDEETFQRVFGGCDWAVMAILARGGQTYARLRFGVGPGAQLLIPAEVDFSRPFPAADHDAWRAEYERHVTTAPDIVLRHLREDALGLNAFHDQGIERGFEENTWNFHDLRDLEALALLETELEIEAAREEMEVPFDTH